MNIKITPNFTGKDIQKDIDKMLNTMVNSTIQWLERIGFEFVIDARTKTPEAGGFNDITGNLRSSIGFIVMYDGKVVKKDFQLAPRGTDRQTGLERGHDLAEKIASEYPHGYALILVAGMEYASFVERKPGGYDVISGSVLGAKSKMKGIWKEVAKQINEG